MIETVEQAETVTVPEKFRDPATGEVRTEALVKSYLALEKKLAGMVDPADGARLRQLLGVPDTPDAYQIDCSHGLFEADESVNARLHEAGLSPAQLQTVYDVAAEKFVPMILEIASDFEAERETERLVQEFGGKEKWREISRQLEAWGRKNLPADALTGLSASYEGVMALYRMMQAGTQTSLGNPASASDRPAGEGDLHAMLKDPRYWRDRDPAFIDKVSNGFRRLYGADA